MYKWLHYLLFFFLVSTGAQAQQWDLRVLESLQESRTPGRDKFWNAGSRSAYPLSIATPLGQLAYGILAKDKASLQNGVETVAGLGLNTLITYGLKHSIGRDRPYITYPQIIPYEYDKGYTFPSGHTSTVFAVATGMSLQYKKWYIAVPVYLYAGAIAYSRVHLGQHYPSDVLAGACVGIASAVVVHKGRQWLQKRHHSQSKKKTEFEY